MFSSEDSSVNCCNFLAFFWGLKGQGAAAQRPLREGCYCWSHNKMLQVVVEYITSAINSSKRLYPHRKHSAFITAADQLQQQSRMPAGLLTKVSNWLLHVDLRRQVKLPESITLMSLRDGMISLSEASKHEELFYFKFWSNHVKLCQTDLHFHYRL